MGCNLRSHNNFPNLGIHRNPSSKPRQLSIHKSYKFSKSKIFAKSCPSKTETNSQKHFPNLKPYKLTKTHQILKLISFPLTNSFPIPFPIHPK